MAKSLPTVLKASLTNTMVLSGAAGSALWQKNPAKTQEIYTSAKSRWDAITSQYDHGAFARAGGHFAVIETALKLASLKALPLSVEDIERSVEDGFLSG